MGCGTDGNKKKRIGVEEDMTFIILTAATIGFGILILSLCRAAGESDRARDDSKEYEDWRGV